MSMPLIPSTDFEFKNLLEKKQGKVRDIYTFENVIVLIATDRISAFDIILPRQIPFKGQILNTIAANFLKSTQNIVPNWFLDSPHPNVTIGKKCRPFPIEMVIRGYLSGHAWREYQSGKRSICGNALPDGLNENDPLPKPIITPTTKATEGHDMDISKEEILSNGLVNEHDYARLELYTYELFRYGTEYSKNKGLILVDTKYEFGKVNGEILLIDEVHTPDSSRYFYANTYDKLQRAGKKQRQLSKEFVRQWLISKGFQGLEGHAMPDLSDEIVTTISDRYKELYETITGEKFKTINFQNNLETVKRSIEISLKSL